MLDPRRHLLDPEDPIARAAALAAARRGEVSAAAVEARVTERARARWERRMSGEESGADDPILPCCQPLANVWQVLGPAHRMTRRHCAALERREEERR